MSFLSLLFFTFLGFSYLLGGATETSNICYFSLSERPAEASVTDSGNKKVEIIEYYTDNNTPQESFKKMINSGKKCDGLVISGHHIGSWYGDKVEGGHLLTLDFIEKISCKPEYKDFFKNIKSLWLDGCNTSPKGHLKSQSYRTADNLTAGYINAHEATKRHNQFISYSYGDVLDRHTPLSSRYLRSFPNAQVYGFSNKAPSEENKAMVTKEGKRAYWNLIQNHIRKLGSHIRKLNLAIEADIEVNKKISDIEVGIKAISSMSNPCSPLDIAIQNKSAEIWNQESGSGNSASHGNKATRKIGCDLVNAKKDLEKNPTSKEAKRKILEALKQIESKEQYHHLFNNIFETYKLAHKSSDDNFFTNVHSILKGTPTQPNIPFKSSLTEKIDSKFNSSIRRIDHLKFYEYLYGRDEAFEKYLKTHILNVKSNYKHLRNSKNKNVITPDTRRVFTVVVAEQLRQYDFLNKGELQDLVANKKIFKEGDSISTPIYHKMKYTLYKKLNESSYENDVTELIKAEPTTGQSIAQEALRTNDIKTINHIFKNIEKFSKTDKDHFTQIEKNIRQGFLNHLDVIDKQSQISLLNDYMEQANENKLFQISLLQTAYDLDNKDFLEQTIPQSKTLKNYLNHYLNEMQNEESE